MKDEYFIYCLTSFADETSTEDYSEYFKNISLDEIMMRYFSSTMNYGLELPSLKKKENEPII